VYVSLRSDFVKLIMAKSYNSNFKLESFLEEKTILLKNIQTCQNQFYSDTKHVLWIL